MDIAFGIIGAALVVAAGIVVAVVIARREQPVSPMSTELVDLHNSLGRVQEQMTQVQTQQRDVLSNVAALVTNPGKRGVWGELTLIRLLENAGLKRSVDFDDQVMLDGGRPDVVVHLGDGGDIVVDSKAPIVDLKDAWDAADRGDEHGRTISIKAFADSIRSYARDLSRRDYAAKLQTTFAPVVMYIPVDGAWEAAREMRPDILSEMLHLGIYPAEPSTMGMTIALLRQHARNSNQEAAVRAIVEDTRRLLDAIRIHVDHLDNVGASLGKAVECFDKAVGNADRTLLSAARRMSEHVDVDVGRVEPVVRGPDMDRVARLGGKVEAA